MVEWRVVDGVTGSGGLADQLIGEGETGLVAVLELRSRKPTKAGQGLLQWCCSTSIFVLPPRLVLLAMELCEGETSGIIYR